MLTISRLVSPLPDGHSISLTLLCYVYDFFALTCRSAPAADFGAAFGEQPEAEEYNSDAPSSGFVFMVRVQSHQWLSSRDDTVAAMRVLCRMPCEAA